MAELKPCPFCGGKVSLVTKGICMMRHIENIPIVGLALCFTTLTRKIRNDRLQAMLRSRIFARIAARRWTEEIVDG